MPAKRESAALCLNPDTPLLCKLGSLIVHADEFMSREGHPFDKQVFDRLLASEDVQVWLKGMGKLGLVPVKR